jgi:hypothetical protein
MTSLLDLWKREPTLILTVVQSLVLLLVAFGIDITAEQQGAIFAVVAAMLALVTGVTIRSQVYSPASVEAIRNETMPTDRVMARLGVTPTPDDPNPNVDTGG